MTIELFEEKLESLIDEGRLSMLTENSIEDILRLKVEEMKANRERFFENLAEK